MAIQMQLQSFSYLEDMVSKPTWKDMLLDLMSSHRIDPWNIDLVALADAFIKEVREMERMDFLLQANVILAASILLKYKSDYLRLLSYQSDMADFPAEGASGMPGIEEIPELSFSSRIPPKRQITIDELVSEMERIIKYEGEPRVHIPRGSIVETVDLELENRNMENDTVLLLQALRGNADAEGWALFSRLTTGYDPRTTVYTLICLLHMVQEGRAVMRQDRLFGEILIRTTGAAEKTSTSS
jgi:chromatin segregation and condensation protein Rec8/ScpA/Scc1 (kleisin family)